MVRHYVKVGVHRHKGRLDDRTRALAIRLIQLGRSTVEVVNESGVSRSQVQRLRNKLRTEESVGYDKMAELIQHAAAFSKEYMEHYDASHDYQHVQRVLGLAKRIESSQRQACPDLEIDGDIVTLACLMHDVGDHKYLEPGQDGSIMVATTLETLGADAFQAQKVQQIVNNVSYSNEIRNPQNVQAILAEYPELGIVQDADRLDAMGAVGIGRAFTYNAARQQAQRSSMDDPVAHIEEKLVKLAPLMKTAAGRAMACEREARLRLFQDWWRDEVSGMADDDEVAKTC